MLRLFGGSSKLPRNIAGGTAEVQWTIMGEACQKEESKMSASSFLFPIVYSRGRTQQPTARPWVWTLPWRHNGHDGVSNHRRLDCLLNRLFRRRSKKTSKLRVTGNPRWPMDSPHKWPATRKCFHFTRSSWICVFLFFFISKINCDKR